MLGSTNDLDVLNAVLGSLAKSPAFSLLEDSHTQEVESAEPVKVLQNVS